MAAHGEDGAPAASANRRFSVITIDQVISGASNVLIAIFAAHYLSVESFGYFGIVLLVYALANGVYRALISDPMLVHSVEADDRVDEVIGTSLVLALGLAVIVLLVGIGLEPVNAQLGYGLIVLAVCMPLLVVQDLGRYLGFALQRPSAAIVLDVAWLLIMLPGIIVVGELAAHTLVSLIAAWAGSGAVAGLLVFVQFRGVRPRLSLSWLHHTWRFSWRYLISYISLQGSALAVLTGVGAIAGAAARGGLQGTLLFIRPYTTFQIASVAAGVGEISRHHLRGAGLKRHATKTTIITSGVAVLNGAVILAIPDGVGEFLLGNAWDATQPLLPPTCALLLGMGTLTGARIGLLGMRLIQKALVIDLVSAAVFLVSTLSGAVLAGAAGALWFGAAGQVIVTLVWWSVFRASADRKQVAPVPHEVKAAARA